MATFLRSDPGIAPITNPQAVQPGTRRARSGEPQKVLPVNMAVSVVEKMDAAWRENGYPSRISFIRAALAKLLVELGEDEVAEMMLR